MKKLKKLCGAVLIAGFMLPQMALGSGSTAEAASGKWKQDGKKWWYSYSDGTYPKSKWEKIGGKWYHFDKWGYMQTGWQKISGKWYYFGTNGIMRSGWQKIGGKWYYFASGVMKTGWLKSGGKWYYFDGSGVMVTGTKTIGGKPYTFGSDGVMKEGSSSSSSYANAKVGDIITFGHYEQDNNTANGKEAIEWQVLDKKQDGSLLLISNYALDCQKYNDAYKSVTWETSSIRKWLNEDFINTAFSASEKKAISTTTVKNEDNKRAGGDGGNDTKDKVFLLNINEAKKYFKMSQNAFYDYTSKSAVRVPTAYAKSQGASTFDYIRDYKGKTEWWLRSPAGGQSFAAYIYPDGSMYEGVVSTAGPRGSVNEQKGICPAMWIKP